MNYKHTLKNITKPALAAAALVIGGYIFNAKMNNSSPEVKDPIAEVQCVDSNNICAVSADRYNFYFTENGRRALLRDQMPIGEIEKFNGTAYGAYINELPSLYIRGLTHERAQQLEDLSFFQPRSTQSVKFALAIVREGIKPEYVAALDLNRRTTYEEVKNAHDITKDPKIANCLHKNVLDSGNKTDRNRENLQYLIRSGKACQTAQYATYTDGEDIVQAAQYNIDQKTLDAYKLHKYKIRPYIIEELQYAGVTAQEHKQYRELNRTCGSDIDPEKMIAYKQQGISFDTIAKIAREKQMNDSVTGENRGSIRLCTAKNIQSIKAGTY